MSETTATRMTRRVWGGATLVLLAGAWAVFAWLLWRSRVPGDLHLPRIDPRSYFSSRELARTAHYERFLRIDHVLSLVALLGALAVFARKGTAFMQPYLVVGSSRPVREPWLKATVRQLERKEGVTGTPVHVLEMKGKTDEVNAFATGVGPSSGVFLFDTFLDGRFTHREIAVVLAHEFGHVRRRHIWKGLAWYALFALPGAYLVTRAVRRRGGLTEPAAIPLALFVLVLLQIVALPVQNVLSRHFA